MPFLSNKSSHTSGFSFFKKIIDAFTRSDNASSLGYGSSPGSTLPVPKQRWKVWRGVWGIATNKASSSTSASTYPVATLTFTQNDVNIGVGGPTPGTGTSFWLSDADNWWAAVYDEVYSCQTCSWSQCNANTCNGTTCNAWTTSCNAFSAVCSTGNCSAWTCTTWTKNSSCVSWVCNSSTCNAFTCSSYISNCNTFTCTAWTRPCIVYNSVCNTWNSTKNCQSWGLGNCSQWSTACNSGNCNSWNRTCVAPSFCNSWTCNATSCGPFNNSYSTTSICNAGNCNSWTCTTWSRPCSTWSTACNSSSCTTWACSTWTSGTVSCNCTTNKKINIVKSISGVITTVTGSIFSGAIASFRSILSGNSITVKAFSSGDYTSQIGSDFIIDSTGASKSKRHGIIKSPATNSQGSTIDEFRVD